MIDFSAPDAWKRPFRNAKKLLFGRAVQGVLSVGYLALATRALGVEGFGVLTLIQATVSLVAMLVTFQASQMILRYGARAMTDKNPGHLKKIIRFGVKIELLAAGIGVLAIWMLTEPLMSLFSLPPEYATMMELYGLVIFFGAVGQIAMGSLQLTDRHDLISWQLTTAPIIKFMGASALLYAGAGVAAFLVLWFASAAISNAILCLLAWRNMKGHIKRLRTQAGEQQPATICHGRFGAPEQGLWNYVWGTSFSSAFTPDIVTVLTATVLGPEGAGLIRIAQKVANLVSQPIQNLLVPAIMTDMTWLNAQGDTAKRREMVFKAGGIAGLVAAVVVAMLIVFGESVITLVAGKEFIAAYPAMVFIALALVVRALIFPVPPLVITAGLIWPLNIYKTANVLLLVVYYPAMANFYGIMGAGMGILLYQIIGALMVTYLAKDLLYADKRGAEHV